MPVVDINGQGIEFPDSMTGDALNAAVKMAASQMAMRPRPNPGGGGVLPDGTATNDPAVWARWMADEQGAAQPGARSTGEQVARGVGLAGKGFNNSIGSAIGAIPDAVGAGLRYIGLPSSAPGQYTKWAQDALNAFGRNDTPENTTEKAIYGAGEGAGNVVSMLAPAGLVARATQAGTVANGVARVMTAQPVLQAASGMVGGAVGEATESPVAGMAAGLAVPLGVSAVRGLISPGAARTNPETRRLVDVAQAEGIPLSPGQVSGSRPLRAAESVFSTLPSTAAKQETINQTQREAFNRAALARAGVTGENLATPEVLQAARDRIGGELGDLAARNTLQVNANVMQGVQSVATEAKKYLPADKAKPVLARIGDFIDKIDTSTFKVDGGAYAKLDSALSTQIRGEADGNVRHVLQQLRDALRTGMDASISGDDAAAWATARRQYANLAMITRAMNQPSAATSAGNIPPAALSTALATGPQRNFALGRGDMNDVTRVGRAFIQDSIPNSGTPERQAMMRMLQMQHLLASSSAGAATGMGTGSPLTGLATAAASYAAPRIAQAAYNTPAVRNYLTNQVADRYIPRVSPQALRAIAAGQARGLLDR